MACPVALAAERVWVDKYQYVDAERKLNSKVSSSIDCWLLFPNNKPPFHLK